MLVGEHVHALDEKKRLSIPAKFRGELGKHIVLSRGLDGCLFLYSQSEWKVFSQKLAQLSMGQSDSRAFNRFVFGGATETDVDSSGRILIPDFLKDFAGLGTSVVLVGVASRVEIWDEGRWRAYTGQVEGRADMLAEKLGDIGMV